MSFSSYRVFLEFLTEIAPRSVAIVTHVNPDPDAVASAVLVKELLLTMSGVQTVTLIFPEGPSALSKRVLDEFAPSTTYIKEGEPDVDAIIVVDTPSSAQLASFSGFVRSKLGRVLVIDHHRESGDLLAQARSVIWKPEAACVLLVLEVARAAGVKLQTGLASLCVAGILYDTARFLRATPSALRAVAELIEQGASYGDAVRVLQERPSLSERVAKLKAASRAIILRVGDVILAGSYVASHEAAAARALLSLGADVAVVAGGKRGEVRISLRASRSFFDRTGISLGKDIVPLLSDVLEGEGGGHDLAAGFNGRGDPQRALSTTLRIIYSELRSRIFSR